MGRIWHGSGSGSLSGQYMTHGASGSREMLRTRPPTLRARPEGVSGGYWGGGALLGICAWAAARALDAVWLGNPGVVAEDGVDDGGVRVTVGGLWNRPAKRGDGLARGNEGEVGLSVEGGAELPPRGRPQTMQMALRL